jgi:hypothetical protein
MTISARITTPIKGSVHEDDPPDPGGAVVPAADCVSVCCSVVIGTVVTTWVGSVVITGAETVIKPGMVVVLSPPEFTAVRMTE